VYVTLELEKGDAATKFAIDVTVQVTVRDKANQ
jgi:hypothetical protein